MPFRCLIVGEGTLPVQCGEILQRAGHEICGVVAAEPGLARWAQDHGVPVKAPTEELTAFAAARPFDYLFSIVNFQIVPDAVLALARKAAINFHDGPLPRYAGSHATSWALANRETTHGVTWHLMTAVIDGGDVLAQRMVDILDGDTAVTLNAKCYQAAVAAFGELVAALDAGTETRTPQDMSARSYFARDARPAAGGVLSWSEGPGLLSARVRSLDFGQYPNPLATPKVLIGGECLTVVELRREETSSADAAGRVVRLSPDGLTVATAGGDVTLRKWRTLDGRALSIETVAARHGVRVGSQLPELDATSAAHARSVLESISRHEPYWIEALRAPEPATIPYATSTPDAGPVRHLPLRVPDAVAARLRVLYPEAALVDCLSAAFAVYLARVTGLEQFDVGYQVRHPSGSAVEDLLVASRVPCRLAIRLEQPFAAVLAAQRDQLVRLARRQTFALDLPGRSPALRQAAEHASLLSWPVAIDRVEAADATAFEMAGAVICLRIGDERACGLVYDAKALSDEAATRVRDHVLLLLDGIVERTEQPVGHLPLVGTAERDQLLVDWNRTAVDYPRDQTVHQLFETQATSKPGSVAVGFENRTLSYHELNRRANQLAHHLVALGVQPKGLVGVCLERSAEMLIAVLGILKAGGAYVPLDPGFPRDRLAFMATDAGLQWVVTAREVEGLVAAADRVLVRIDVDAEAIARRPDGNPGVPVAPDDLAYVLYTSGSTGRPKGVEVSHRALTNFLWAMRSEPGCSEHDTVLAITTLSFDIAGLELYLPLICGGRVEIVSRRTAADGRLLQERIERAGVTLMQATPATWRMLLETGWKGAPALTALCGGEALPLDLARALASRTRALWNMYGPTETTIWSSVQRVEANATEITIGRPIANTEFFVLDAHLEPVPVGVPGELFIGGDGLARGYRDRPELTADRFPSHPFSNVPSARIYRTGDLARYRADGQVIHLGRLDHQVKLRGFRIELGEIEALISTHPDVQAVTVVARDTELGSAAYLAAYVVPTAGAPAPSAAELRGWLKDGLPDYMIPSAFVPMEALPLTPNGKVDRKALPVPQRGRARLESAYVAPRTPIEEAIVSAWTAALKVERVGVNDNFFELGGHSLSGLEISVKIGESLGAEIPLQALFECPTPATLAVRVEEALLAQVDDALLEQLLAQIENPPMDDQTPGAAGDGVTSDVGVERDGAL